MNLNDLRYDRPGTYWFSVCALGFMALATTFLILPQNTFFEAAGISDAQRRVHALRNAAYWYGRSVIHASSMDLAFDVRYGNAVRFEAGSVIASIPREDQFLEQALHLADVVVKSEAGAREAVREVRYLDARFEIYDADKAVVWIEGKPLNITLIERGAAVPDPNPPTNIVDRAFASYYWKQAKGELP
ncbi:hypothetical protein [Stenotrophomonas maltophilia]|uniref:hypothetical protein n=1 Tax=Stenotrophomonas maltophilia TaxID=40324 RepID=UPI00313EC6CC